MPNAPTSNDTRRSVERLGEAIDIVNYTEGTESEHGETRGSTSTVSTVGVIDQPSGRRDADETGVADVEIDVQIRIPDSVTGIRDGGGRLASEVDVDQDGDVEYRVEYAESTTPGVTRLDCVSITGTDKADS